MNTHLFKQRVLLPMIGRIGATVLEHGSNVAKRLASVWCRPGLKDQDSGGEDIAVLDLVNGWAINRYSIFRHNNKHTSTHLCHVIYITWMSIFISRARRPITFIYTRVSSSPPLRAPHNSKL
jgi:hypothetical protein